MSDPIPGSVKRNCERCNAPTWFTAQADSLVPAGYGEPSYVCLHCVDPDKKGVKMMPPSAEQLELLAKQGLDLRNIPTSVIMDRLRSGMRRQRNQS